MNPFKKLKQRFCNHQMIAGWGLCIKCGWADPNWSAEREVELALPFMFDENYRKTFLRHIQLDGKMTMMRLMIESGKKIPKEMMEEFDVSRM